MMSKMRKNPIVRLMTVLAPIAMTDRAITIKEYQLIGSALSDVFAKFGDTPVSRIAIAHLTIEMTPEARKQMREALVEILAVLNDKSVGMVIGGPKIGPDLTDKVSRDAHAAAAWPEQKSVE